MCIPGICKTCPDSCSNPGDNWLDNDVSWLDTSGEDWSGKDTVAATIDPCCTVAGGESPTVDTMFCIGDAAGTWLNGKGFVKPDGIITLGLTNLASKTETVPCSWITEDLNSVRDFWIPS